MRGGVRLEEEGERGMDGERRGGAECGVGTSIRALTRPGSIPREPFSLTHYLSHSLSLNLEIQAIIESIYVEQYPAV